MEKQKKKWILVIQDFSIALLPICYVTIIPYFIKVMKDHTVYSQQLHIVVQSILFLVAGWLLLELEFMILNQMGKEDMLDLFSRIIFCCIIIICILCMIMYRDIQVPLYLYLLVRYGDLHMGFLVIGFYSNLVILFKRKGATIYEEK